MVVVRGREGMAVSSLLRSLLLPSLSRWCSPCRTHARCRRHLMCPSYIGILLTLLQPRNRRRRVMPHDLLLTSPHVILLCHAVPPPDWLCATPTPGTSTSGCMDCGVPRSVHQCININVYNQGKLGCWSASKAPECPPVDIKLIVV